MKKFITTIHVFRKPDVLNPEEGPILAALHHLGFTSMTRVKSGKYFEIQFDAPDEESARKAAESMSRKFLAFSVAECFEVVSVVAA